MTPWQWQDKINYEIMVIEGARSRIESLVIEAEYENKQFSGCLRLARSFADDCIGDLRAAGDLAHAELKRETNKDEL